ncbi:MAG TPA: sulfite exporter TauE/SafE family protein [Candidatus Saccharimonadales bacterium]|nr:sulfite exporter TauE/SafE family protein [Candidatus Saccharimonadales bacterium]
MHDVILFLVGIIVGAMNAIAGGGMLIGFPVLLAIGVPAIAANATTGLIVLPGNLAASISYRKYLKRVPRSYLLLILPAIIGSVIGAFALRHTSPDDFEKIVPCLVAFAVVLFTFQPFLHSYIHDHIHGPKRLRESIRPIYLVALAVFPLAIYAAYFGAGFGFIMLAFLGFTRLHDHIHRMNALKNVTGIFIAATALLSLLGSGLIDWHHGLVMASGGIVGGIAGSVYIQRVSSQLVRYIIIVVGISTAAYLGFRSY